VPPTVLRDGPFGPGMCQLWIDTDPDRNADTGPDADAGAATGAGADRLVALHPAGEPVEGWLPVIEATLSDGAPVVLAHRDDGRLRRIAVFDAVVNNADRKGGHLLPTVEGHLYGVDHGLCFNSDHKLRTLLWGWAGEPLTAEATEVLTRLAADLEGRLGRALGELLTATEVRVTAKRVAGLLRSGRHPEPGGGWPAVPWPPF
jgi:uncharacterized repeat protein (TIGR03843 family)